MNRPGENAELEGRIALVTGASGGIGRALSLRLAAEGAALALHHRSGEGAARELAAQVSGAGGRAAVFGADPGEPRPESMIDEVERELGPVDVLVANAGVGRQAGWEDTDAALFDEALAVNLCAPFLLARRVLPGMRERRYGRILFTSSIAAITDGVVGPHYAASKAGLHGLTHHLARRDGVTVNAIAPA